VHESLPQSIAVRSRASKKWTKIGISYHVSGIKLSFSIDHRVNQSSCQLDRAIKYSYRSFVVITTTMDVLLVYATLHVSSRIVLEQAARRAVLPMHTRIRHLPHPAFKTSNTTHTKPEKSCSRTGQNGVRLRSALLRICHAHRLRPAGSTHRCLRNTHSEQESGRGTVQ
jgi:hypothetical protein